MESWCRSCCLIEFEGIVIINASTSDSVITPCLKLFHLSYIGIFVCQSFIFLLILILNRKIFFFNAVLFFPPHFFFFFFLKSQSFALWLLCTRTVSEFMRAVKPECTRTRLPYSIPPFIKLTRRILVGADLPGDQLRCETWPIRAELRSVCLGCGSESERAPESLLAHTEQRLSALYVSTEGNVEQKDCGESICSQFGDFLF